jgi:hypothetical protein
MSKKQVTFQSNYHLVTVHVGSNALAVHAEVEVTLKKPANLSPMDEHVWSQITEKSAGAVSLELVPGDG